MKKAYLLIAFVAVFFLPQMTFAGTFTFPAGTPDPAAKIVTASTSLSFAIEGSSGLSLQDPWYIKLCKGTKNQIGTCGEEATYTAPAPNDKISDSIKGLVPDTAYTLFLKGKGTTDKKTHVTYYQIKTDPSITAQLVGGDITKNADYQWPLDFSKSVNGILKGKVSDPSKYTNAGITFILKYSSTDPNVGDDAQHVDVYQDSDRTKPGVASDGTYYFVLPRLDTSSVYYIQQVIASSNVTSKSPIDHFNSTTGYLATPADVAKDASLHTYKLLAPLPGLTAVLDPAYCQQQKIAGNVAADQICDINQFINYMFTLLIGLGAVGLVLRLIYSGYIYMTTDAPFTKATAKSGIVGALFGLVLALSAYIILNTINPKLVSNDISIQTLQISTDGDKDAPTTIVNIGGLPNNVSCPKNGKSSSINTIAKSWAGKVTYTYGGKNPTAQSDGTAHLDCSAYVVTVLNCAGYTAGTDYINGGTSGIFAGAEKVTDVTSTTVNNVALKPGDLVGWTAGGGEQYGHVLIYIGDGMVMDSHGGNGHPVGAAIGTTSITSHASRIKFIKRIPN